jgi:hypothetical protein
MKVFDRYAGRETDLPQNIMPGRFRLLGDAGPGCELGLEAGQVLVGDTWNDLPLGPEGAVVLQAGQPGADQERFELLGLAVSTLVRAPETGQFSPLMPASVGELVELEELERVLIERIAHLREINLRPRMSMHYESEVAPLSRVRKLAPSAITYLAAHSEDWHRRTLSGIAPKRILGLFSEDELGIYENRIYKRLLDKLDRHLRKRLGEIASLLAQFEQALELGRAEDLDYRLREDLCALWGNTFSGDETQHLLDASRDTLQVLTALRKQVRVLRNGVLYSHLPRALSVPEQLRETNILQHDQHYRHLRTLWRLHQERNLGATLTARQAVARNLALLQDHVVYVGKLGRRALAGITLLEHRDGRSWFAGREFWFTRRDDEWHLECGDAELVLVPTLRHEALLPEAASGAGRRVLVCLQHPGGADPDNLEDCDVDCRTVSISPGDFYGLEKIKMVVEAFLWRTAFAEYGRPLGKLPGAVSAKLLAKGWLGSVEGGGLGMLVPVDPEDEATFLECLQTGELNEETQVALCLAANNLRTLSSCRECGRRVGFEERQSGFRVRCEDCFTTSKLSTENGKRVAQMMVDSDSARTFRAQGARYLRLEISPAPVPGGGAAAAQKSATSGGRVQKR